MKNLELWKDSVLWTCLVCILCVLMAMVLV